jgi:hypothetical protein
MCLTYNEKLQHILVFAMCQLVEWPIAIKSQPMDITRAMLTMFEFVLLITKHNIFERLIFYTKLFSRRLFKPKGD